MRKISYKKYRKMSFEKILKKFKDPQARWALMSALRGPDSSDCGIYKRVFTGFIRGRGDFALDILFFEDAIAELELSYLNDEKAQWHYVYHLRVALVHLEELGIDGIPRLLRRLLAGRNTIDEIRDIVSKAK